MTYPLNSLSGDQCLQVQLNLQEVALDQTHYCFYNRLPPSVGDGDRCFYQGDGGSENGMFGNYNEGIYRLWAAALRPGDRHYARHPTRPSQQSSRPRSKDWVDHLGRILVHDTLPAPLHKGGHDHRQVHWGGPQRCRLLWELSPISPAAYIALGTRGKREGRTCRERNQRLFRIWTGAFYVVHVRRMHTQGRLAGWQASLLQVAPAGTNGAAR